jgi:hypothetical protein
MTPAETIIKEYVARALIKRYNRNDTVRFHEKNKKSIDRYLNRKVNVLADSMLSIFRSNQLHRLYNNDSCVKSVRLDDYKDNFARLTLNDKSTWSITPLSEILFYKLRNGHTGLNTALRLRESLMDALTAYAIEQQESNIWKYKNNKDIDLASVISTPINTGNLSKEIKQWRYEISNKTLSLTNQNKLLRNICVAQTIMNSLVNGNLLQEMERADSGRIYLKGLNLQNCPRDVRHAALGNYHHYDLRVGAFAVMAGLANTWIKQNNMDYSFPHIREYIRCKEQHRKRITAYIYKDEFKDFIAAKPKDRKHYKRFHGFQKVKSALTSIGFGAQLSSNASWQDIDGNWQSTSLRKIFKDKDNTELFVDCPYTKGILEDYILATDIVMDRYKKDEVFRNHFNIQKKLSNGKILAMIYQNIESYILDSFIENINYEGVQVPVHDGLYISGGIDLFSVIYKLDIPFIDNKDYIQFDHTRNIIDNTQAHYNFINEEERAARLIETN